MPIVNEKNTLLTELFDDFISQKNSRLFILREDLIHPIISGNKWRKLKYNILEAQKLNQSTILTFGGAYSNHIAATAAACKEYGLKSIGIIRGEEQLPLNTTLQQAVNDGMVLTYISRSEYKNKMQVNFLKALEDEFGDFYMVPEGGSNVLAVKGCTEILANVNVDFDVICTAVGTGGTMAGLVASTNEKVLGFPALKGGDFLVEEVNILLDKYSEKFKVATSENWGLITDYHFGGYAKIKPELIEFVTHFKQKHNIALDLIYTGKMLFGIVDLLKNTSELNGKTIVVIHTGGLQGNAGFKSRFGIEL